MSTEPPEQGSFEAGEFPSLLRALQAFAAGGRLEVSAGPASCTLFLENGRVEAIAADEETYKLGRWLVGRGRLQADRMALALLKQPDGVPFGRQLVEEGLITPETLREELQLRAAALVGLLVFSPGSFRFMAGGTFPPSAVRLDLGTTALLLAAGRSSDDSRIAELLGSSQTLQASDDALDRAHEAMLSPQEAYLLSRLDRETTTDRVRQLVPLPGAEVDRTLAALVVAGLAELRGELDPGQAAGAQAGATAPAQAAGAQGGATAPEQAVRPGPVLTHDQEREAAAVRHRAAVGASWDLYRRLGLSRGATQDQVNERYRELSRMYSPERMAEPHLANLGAELEAIRATLDEAYAVLSSPVQRQGYDTQLKSSRAPRASGGAPAKDEAGARKELARANIRRARELMRLGQIGEAVQLLDQAVRFDAQPEVLLTLARLEMNNPMWRQRSLDRLKSALAIDPQFTDAWLELARFWGRRKEVGRQQECLRRILEYDPANPAAQEMLSAGDAKRK